MNYWRLTALFIGIFFALAISANVAFASPTLKIGSNGQNVIILQKKLQELGFKITSVDGVFGKETQNAVIAFQKSKKLNATGVVSNSTWRALRDTKSPQPEVKTTFGKQYLLDAGKAKKLIATAKKYIGTPYASGGTTPKAFDCSGYLQYVFNENGIKIPRTADEQYDRLGKHAKNRRDLVPGDLVFFNTDSIGVSHVGLYLGGDEFIHASSSKGVRIDAMDNAYWQLRYVGGNHIVK